MPSAKQMEKKWLLSAGNPRLHALLEDARADARPSGSSIVALRLSEIPQHLLRVGYRRCGRTVEVEKVDAIRLYGERAVWKEVGQRLLDGTCTQQRTGRHEEDGCWPAYDAP
jgi:hypothetical protein